MFGMLPTMDDDIERLMNHLINHNRRGKVLIKSMYTQLPVNYQLNIT